MKMPNWLEKRATLSPDRPALISGVRTLTFSELNDEVDKVTDNMLHLGIGQEQRVAILSGNSTDFVIIVHALMKCQAVLVPLNVRNADDELIWQLKNARVRWLIYEDEQSTRAKKLEKMLPDSFSAIAITEVTVDLLTTGQDQVNHTHRCTHIDLNRVHTIMYTSGTTGRPKGALLTYGNHWWSAIGSALNMGLHADDRWLVALPLFHIGGLAVLLRSVIYGTSVILHRQFNAKEVNRSIERDQVTIMSVVSTMLRRMIDARGDKRFPCTLRMLLAGGGPVPLPLLERCRLMGAPVVQTYGMTETASQAVTLPPEDALIKPGSSGKPLFPNEIKIVSADGPTEATATNELTPAIGEIYIRGPSVSPGYLGEIKLEDSSPSGPSEITDIEIRENYDWLKTGDLGYFDEDGYLYVVDRLSDLIISGGENIYPREVERVLESHPIVAEAAVVGVIDDEWGHVPVAYVVINDESDSPNEADILDMMAYCKQQLAPFKVPHHIEIVSKLPKNTGGKLLRHRLQSRAAEMKRGLQ